MQGITNANGDSPNPATNNNNGLSSTRSHPNMHIDIPPTSQLSRSPSDLPSALDGGVLGETSTGPLDGEVDLEPTTPSAARPAPQRGILKNGFRRPSQIGEFDKPATDAERVQWDEKNLQETEIGKDSLMKIDEPKTPYVWGNPEKDMILSDVPDMDLQSPTAPLSPARSAHSGTGSSNSDRRPSMTSSSRSGSSSRSASFSLPTKDHPVRPGGSARSRTPSDAGSAHLVTPSTAPDGSDGNITAMPTGQGLEVTGMALGATSANTAANAQRPPGVDGNGQGEVFGDDDSDEEMDEEAREKHREFKGKRKEHYAMEAKAALTKARELMDQDEAEAAANGDGDEEEDGDGMEVDDIEDQGGMGAVRRS